MKVVKEGDKVQIIFEAKLENGDVAYKNDRENLVEIVVGDGNFFPAVEKELEDMKEGETKTLTLEPKDAFGPHMDDLMVEVPREAFRSDAKLSVGSRIKINTPSGKTFYGTITNLKDGTVTLDLNHPLAGKRMMFTVTVVSIEKIKT